MLIDTSLIHYWLTYVAYMDNIAHAIIAMLTTFADEARLCVLDLCVNGIKAKIHRTSFPVASPYNKLALTKVLCVCIVSCRFPNSITTTCCRLVTDLLRANCTVQWILAFRPIRYLKSYGRKYFKTHKRRSL